MAEFFQNENIRGSYIDYNYLKIYSEIKDIEYPYLVFYKYPILIKFYFRLPNSV